MKLVSYLQALLARFYSKTDADKAEIVSLQRLNYQSTQVLLNTNASGVNTQVFTAPSDGVFISYINNGTVYNGISNLANFETLINFSGQSWGGSNSACWSRVSKGDRIQCHLNTTMETNITVKFVPFMGGVNFLLAFADYGRALLCLSFSRTSELCLKLCFLSIIPGQIKLLWASRAQPRDLSLQLMGMRLSWQGISRLLTRLTSTAQECNHSFRAIWIHGALSGFLAERDRQSSLISTGLPILPCGLSKAWLVHSSSLNGGVA